MYLFTNAVLLPKGKNKTWTDTDISMMLLMNVFKNFQDGFIELKDSLNPSVRLFLDYQTLKQLTIPFYNMAFETWLLTIPVNSLPTTLVEPHVSLNPVLYSDAIQAQFRLDKQGNDVWLHKDNINTVELHTKVLTSVNGFLHVNQPAPDGESLCIPNALQLKARAFNNVVGLYSFRDIGNVQQVPITLSMIKDTNVATKRYQSVLLDSGIDLTGKTVLLSIAGYLHALDKTYDVINEHDGLISLHTGQIDFVQRVFELNPYYDLEVLGLSTSQFAPDAIAIKELTEDNFINKILTLPLSFIIVVDTPRMFVEKQLAIRPPHCGWYESLKEPLFPLLSSTGRELTYIRRKQVDRWVATVLPFKQPNYIIHTTEYEDARAINQSLSEEGYTIQPAYFLALYSQFLS